MILLLSDRANSILGIGILVTFAILFLSAIILYVAFRIKETFRNEKSTKVQLAKIGFLVGILFMIGGVFYFLAYPIIIPKIDMILSYPNEVKTDDTYSISYKIVNPTTKTIHEATLKLINSNKSEKFTTDLGDILPGERYGNIQLRSPSQYTKIDDELVLEGKDINPLIKDININVQASAPAFTPSFIIPTPTITVTTPIITPVISPTTTTPTPTPSSDNAIITSFVPPTDIKSPGSTITSYVSIQNKGAKTRAYWVETSFQRPDGTWLESLPKQTNILTPDSGQTLTFNWNLSQDSPPGIYNARASIWNDYNGAMIGPEYDQKDLPAFTVETPTPANMTTNVTSNVTSTPTTNATSNVTSTPTTNVTSNVTSTPTNTTNVTSNVTSTPTNTTNVTSTPA